MPLNSNHNKRKTWYQIKTYLHQGFRIPSTTQWREWKLLKEYTSILNRHKNWYQYSFIFIVVYVIILQKDFSISHHTVIVALLLFSMLLARLERMVILPLSLATANRGTLPPVCKYNNSTWTQFEKIFFFWLIKYYKIHFLGQLDLIISSLWMNCS